MYAWYAGHDYEVLLAVMIIHGTICFAAFTECIQYNHVRTDSCRIRGLWAHKINMQMHLIAHAVLYYLVMLQSNQHEPFHSLTRS